MFPRLFEKSGWTPEFQPFVESQLNIFAQLVKLNPKKKPKGFKNFLVDQPQTHRFWLHVVATFRSWSKKSEDLDAGFPGGQKHQNSQPTRKHRYKWLVGGFNPSEKYYIVKLRNLPQVGMKIKNVWNHHPDEVRPWMEGEQHNPMFTGTKPNHGY